MQTIRALLSAAACVSAAFVSGAFGQNAPAKLEFEVASVKSSAAPVGGSSVDIGVRINGAQVHIISFSLKDTIGFA